MYIVDITYKVDFSVIEQHMAEHLAFVNEQFELGHFITAGKKVPRTGGLVIVNMDDDDELNKMLALDPFMEHNLADYHIIKFVPSKSCPELSALLK